MECVGDGKRKGEKPISHFTHMSRVAFLVKRFFPEDVHGRLLGMLHDTKEEAKEGEEDLYKEADTRLNLIGMSDLIDLLTEDEVALEEVDAEKEKIPSDFDPKYFAEYKKYIKKLHQNWDEIGGLELCDRLDGAYSLEYLLNPKYNDRRKIKALESFGRVWATISISNHPIAEEIKERCRIWFDKMGVNEKEVENTAKLFLD